MSSQRIMIFTDDRNDETGLIKILESWGYITYSFPIKSPEVFDSLKIKPDLIIMDLSKESEINGLNVASDIVNKFDTPVIYLAEDHDDTSLVNEALTKDHQYIHKPLNVEELKLAIEMAIYSYRTNKKLKEDEANFKLFYNSAPIAYQSLDTGGYIIEVNGTWLEKMGYKREDVIGTWFGDYLSPEYVQIFKDNFPKFKTVGEIYGVNFEMIRSDRSNITASFDGKIGYDEKGDFKQTHCVFQDITEQKKAEKAIKESEQYYKTIFENTGTATIIVEEDSTISLMNTEFENLYGYSKEDIEGKRKWTEFVEPKHLSMMKKFHATRRINPEEAPRHYEFNLIDRYGNKKNIYTTIAIIPGTRKSLVSLQDITDRNYAENQLKTSLNEKDMLLREIHHRVKNNLQIISSLLNLQSRYIEDEDALDVFTESQNRVRSMAIIHEKLYKSESMSKIDFEEYITDLTDSLFYNYRVEPSRIQLNKKIDKIFFDVDTAIPCGLIINELITNCLKHAFPDDNKGSIDIVLFKREDNYVLNINDTGVGFPEKIDFKNTESLGLQLVNNLVNQLDGEIELDGVKGTRFNIIFNELAYKKRV